MHTHGRYRLLTAVFSGPLPVVQPPQQQHPGNVTSERRARRQSCNSSQAEHSCCCPAFCITQTYGMPGAFAAKAAVAAVNAASAAYRAKVASIFNATQANSSSATYADAIAAAGPQPLLPFTTVVMQYVDCQNDPSKTIIGQHNHHFWLIELCSMTAWPSEQCLISVVHNFLLLRVRYIQRHRIWLADFAWRMAERHKSIHPVRSLAVQGASDRPGCHDDGFLLVALEFVSVLHARVCRRGR